MNPRPLHAVLLTGPDGPERLLGPLRAALDGTGPAILPIDPGLPPARLEDLLAAFAPSAIWTPDGLRPLRGSRTAGRNGADVNGADVNGADATPGVADDVAVVLATSGSTGTPKAAELTARALLASASASLDRIGAAVGQRWLCCLPVHHISGLGVLVRSLVHGSEPSFTGRLDAQTLARALTGPGRVDHVSLVPTQLRKLLEADAPVGKLRTILLGGAAIAPDLLTAAARAGARVVTTYGMTETCGGCVYDGVPLGGVRVRTARDGRLQIKGPVLFSRYRLSPRLTRDALLDGWFTTSDLGGPGPDGRLVIRGRADDVINTGGEKVLPGEVEQLLRSSSRVRDAVVVGSPDQRWGERVTALVVPADPDRPPSLAHLRDVVCAGLPRYAAPHTMVLLPAIPLLSSGKPDRQSLRKLAAETPVWPRTPAI